MDFSKLSPEQFKVAEMVIEAAEANNIDPNLLLAQAFRESTFTHKANEETDAFGVMQIRPGTAKQNNLGDITDLRTNVFGGAKLMRQYLDEFKSPEAALIAYHQGPSVARAYVESGGDLKAVGQKGLDYVINIVENGGFGQPAQDDGATEVNPFESYVSESSKFKEDAPPVVNPNDKQGNTTNAKIGAMSGAVANTLLPMLTDPKVSPRVDTSRAQEANISAQDKLELARRNLNEAVPQGAQNLEESFRQGQGNLERLKNEQRLAEARLKGLPKASSAMEPLGVSAASEATPRTKAGASGAVNYVNAMSDDVPEVLANQALNMRKDNPRGGQAIIDANTRAIQKQADLGLSNYGLTRTAGGVELALPPTTVAERQADIDQQSQARQAELAKRTEQARVQQENQARQLEQQRLANEANLERLRQERSQAGQRQNEMSRQIKSAAPFQRALTKAETDAEIAKRKLSRANQQPSAAGRVFEGAGVSSAKMGALPRAAVGAGLGYLGVMSFQEAVARYKAGDTSEAVLKALQAGAAGAAMLPPAGKGLTKLKGAGLIGTIGLGGLELGRRFMKDLPPEK